MLSNKIITYCTIIFAALATSVSSFVVDDDGCRTSNRGVGNCVLAKFCEPIVNLVLSAPKPFPNYIQEKIRSYICGYENNSYKVCCPSEPIALAPPHKNTFNEQAPKELDKMNTNVKQKPIMRIPDEVTDRDEEDDITSHKNFDLLPQECGVVSSKNKISNGENAGLGEFPWMALLSYNTNSGPKFLCGGTIINDRYILTAAHCITKLKNELIGVRVGEYDTKEKVDCEVQEDDSTKCAPPAQDFRIEEMIPHPNFTFTNGYGDIGLLRVAPMNMSSDYITPICLPSGEFIKDIPKRLIISGWGFTEGVLKPSPILQKASVPIITLDECNKFYERRRMSISNKQICLKGKDNQESCQGDSGGPLQSYGYIYDEIRCIQYGIISHGGKICGAGVVPEPHTKLSKYMMWILDNIRS